MSYLEYSDDDTEHSTNKFSRFNHESQCEVKQIADDKVTLYQMITLRQVRTLSVTHRRGMLLCEYFQVQTFLYILQ